MKKTIIQLLIVGLMSMTSFAQSTRSGDKQYDGLAYVNAIKTYERLVTKNIKSPEILQKLGNSYYFNADLLKAGTAYKQLFEITEPSEPEYYYRYSQCLKAAQDYEGANKMLAKFEKKSGNDLRAKLAISQKDYLNVIKRNSGNFAIKDAGINSQYSDYGSSYYNGKLVFASARKNAEINGNYSAWTGEKFTDLFQSDLDLGGNLSNTSKLSSVINSKYNESTPVFSNDGNTVYFTRNNFINGKRSSDTKKTTLLKIYKATFTNGKWGNITSLPFNSDDYQVAHPALSNDEKTLYFASDMPGSLGQSDLFKVSINGPDSYGTPVNLGNKINTEGRETFPFISKNNELLFASDGHPGLGGLDVFRSKITNSNFEDVVNMGEPLNSSFDDFSLVLDSSNKMGFITSNRPSGKGSDDIYKVQFIDNVNNPNACNQSLVGTVTDQSTGNTMVGAKVILFDASMTQVKEMKSDGNGKFDFGSVPCGSRFYVRTSQPDFITVETPVLVSNTTGITYSPILLGKLNKPINEGDDLAKLLEIPMIYFDLDKSYIRDDAAVELSKILDVMQQNPSLKIDIRSHTDCRNTAQYNADLSGRRAKSTIDWLVAKGISAARLTGRGYGESRLTNGCIDGVKCTEEEHQANRRSEFIVLKK